MKGFMARISPHHDVPWLSRDYVAEIKCACTRCYMNNQSGYCASPAAVKVDEHGECALYAQQRTAGGSK